MRKVKIRLESQVEERQAEMAAIQKELSDLKAKKDRLSKQVLFVYVHDTCILHRCTSTCTCSGIYVVDYVLVVLLISLTRRLK